MFGLGQTELIILAIIILLLFGNRLPSVMRSLGRGVVEFKKGVSGIEDDVQQVSHQQNNSTGGSQPAANQPSAGPSDTAAK
jgi:sec-independent protein translocase protein TatA